MNSRQELVLQTLLDKYIRTGLPISSSLIASELAVSSATIRNELTALEEQGYILQPHTSAGRLPTELAYRWLLAHLASHNLPDNQQQVLSTSLGDRSELAFKQTAKTVAELSGLAVFWVFHRHHVYYTGVANLLAQPEFTRTDLVCNISQIIDRLDEIVNEVFPAIKAEPEVLLGQNNPFGSFAGTVVAKYKLDDRVGMVGILGPVRMDYGLATQIIKYLSGELNKGQKGQVELIKGE